MQQPVAAPVVLVNYTGEVAGPRRSGAYRDPSGSWLGSRPCRAHWQHRGAGHGRKDVLDLQLSVLDLQDAQRAFDQPLSALGFVRLTYEYDHVPAGTKSSREEWRKRFWIRRGASGGDVNLHVRRVGSSNERLALLFRDWLRAHPDVVPAYAAFKTALAAAVADLDVYTDIKDPVVDLIVSVAEPWAQTAGWQPHS